MNKLRALVQILSPRSREATVCEACGGPFTCGASLTGCWCAEIKLSDDTRAELRSRYGSCLCRQCLTAFAETQVIPSIVDNAR